MASNSPKGEEVISDWENGGQKNNGYDSSNDYHISYLPGNKFIFYPYWHDCVMYCLEDDLIIIVIICSLNL